MARKPPTIAQFARPDLTPVPVLLGAAADGLKELGQHAAAGYLHGVRVSGTIDAGHTARVETIGRTLLDIESAYTAAGLEGWATATARVAKLLRAAIYRRFDRRTHAMEES